MNRGRQDWIYSADLIPPVSVNPAFAVIQDALDLPSRVLLSVRFALMIADWVGVTGWQGLRQ